MIKGIGTDIVEVARIKPELAIKIFSPAELDIYQGLSLPKRKAEFLAGRFAAKEAISKALSHVDFELSFNEFDIRNDEFGKPYLVCEKLKNYRVLLSISHENSYAIAFCIIE